MMVNVGITSENGKISSKKLIIAAYLPLELWKILVIIMADNGAQTKSKSGTTKET